MVHLWNLGQGYIVIGHIRMHYKSKILKESSALGNLSSLIKHFLIQQSTQEKVQQYKKHLSD